MCAVVGVRAEELRQGGEGAGKLAGRQERHAPLQLSDQQGLHVLLLLLQLLVLPLLLSPCAKRRCLV